MTEILDLLDDSPVGFSTVDELIEHHRSAFPLNENAMQQTPDHRDIRRRMNAIRKSLADGGVMMRGPSRVAANDTNAAVEIVAELDRSGNFKSGNNRQITVQVDRDQVNDETLAFVQCELSLHGFPSIVTLTRKILIVPGEISIWFAEERTLTDSLVRQIELISDAAINRRYRHVNAEAQAQYVGECVVAWPDMPSTSFTSAVAFADVAHEVIGPIDAVAYIQGGIDIPRFAAQWAETELDVESGCAFFRAGVDFGSAAEAMKAGASADDILRWTPLLGTRVRTYSANARSSRHVPVDDIRKINNLFSSEEVEIVLAAGLGHHGTIAAVSLVLETGRAIAPADAVDWVRIHTKYEEEFSRYDVYKLARVCARESLMVADVAPWVPFAIDNNIPSDLMPGWITCGMCVAECSQWARLIPGSSVELFSPWIADGYTPISCAPWFTMEGDRDRTLYSLEMKQWWEHAVPDRVLTLHEISELIRVGVQSYQMSALTSVLCGAVRGT